MTIKRVFTSEGKVGGTDVDIVGYVLQSEIRPEDGVRPDVTVYIREPVVNINFGMTPAEARRVAAALVGAADASEAAARAVATVPTVCPLCDSSRIRKVEGLPRWLCDSCSGSFPGVAPAGADAESEPA